MADDKKDVKPDLEAINIKIKAADGEETLFKVKRSTKMRKIFDAYASRVGQQKASLRFVRDGTRVEEEDTPESLELEDGEQIDVMLMQTGGGYPTA